MTKSPQHRPTVGTKSPERLSPSLGRGADADPWLSSNQNDVGAGPTKTTAGSHHDRVVSAVADEYRVREAARGTDATASSTKSQDLEANLGTKNQDASDASNASINAGPDAAHFRFPTDDAPGNSASDDALPIEPADEAPHASRQRSPADVRERIVLLSIALVATAMTSMLHIQFGYPLLVAMTSSALFMVISILMHQLMLRAGEVRRLRRELERKAIDKDLDDDVPFAPDGVTGLEPDFGGVNASTDRPAKRSDSKPGSGGASPDAHQTAPASETWTLRPRESLSVDADETELPKTVETDLERVQRKIRQLALEVNGTADASASAPDASGDGHQARSSGQGQSMSNMAETEDDDLATANDGRPAFGRRGTGLEKSPRAPSLKVDGRGDQPAADNQLETSINRLKEAATSMRTNGLPTAAPASSSRTVTGAEAIPSFSDPFALPATVERIAGSRQSSRTRTGSPSLGAPKTSDAVTTSTKAGSSDDLGAHVPEKTEPAKLPELKIPATAAPVHRTSAQRATTAHVTPPPTQHRSEYTSDIEGSLGDRDDPFDFADVIAAALPPPNPRLEAIARAIERGRMEVSLAPIVGLDTHAVSHYTIEVHLVGEDGATIDDAQDELVLESGDLLALFDEARLRRAATLAGQLVSRNKPGSLMSEASGASVSRQPFADAVTEIGGEAPMVASRLVLNFPQRDVLRFTSHDWQAISDMQAFGFRFALSDVEKLDQDFSELSARGFLFVCASARQLIDGFGKAPRTRPASEACQRFAAAGLTVVATDVTDPADRAKVFGFGALFGQGTLFGAPRKLPVAPWQPNGSNGRNSSAAA